MRRGRLAQERADGSKGLAGDRQGLAVQAAHQGLEERQVGTAVQPVGHSLVDVGYFRHDFQVRNGPEGIVAACQPEQYLQARVELEDGNSQVNLVAAQINQLFPDGRNFDGRGKTLRLQFLGPLERFVDLFETEKEEGKPAFSFNQAVERLHSVTRGAVARLIGSKLEQSTG